MNSLRQISAFLSGAQRASTLTQEELAAQSGKARRDLARVLSGTTDYRVADDRYIQRGFDEPVLPLSFKADDRVRHAAFWSNARRVEFPGQQDRYGSALPPPFYATMVLLVPRGIQFFSAPFAYGVLKE